MSFQYQEVLKQGDRGGSLRPPFSPLQVKRKIIQTEMSTCLNAQGSATLASCRRTQIVLCCFHVLTS